MIIFLSIIFEFAIWVFVGTIIVKRVMRKNSGKSVKKEKRKQDIACECEESHNQPKSEYTYCDFCGAKIKRGSTRCSSCKAKLNK